MSKDLLAIIRDKKNAIQAQSGRREKTTRAQNGKNQFRILPTWRKEGGQFWHDFGQHFVKGLDGQLKAVYICADKTFSKPCAICDGLGKAINSATDDAAIGALKEAKASSRILVNALNRSAWSEDANTPVILELSPSTFEKVLEIMETWATDGTDMLSLDEGMDILITRTGKGLQTEYTVQPAPKSAKVSTETLRSLHDLDAYVAQESVDERNRALTAVHAVVGLLPAGTETDRLTKTLPSADFDDGEEDLRALETGVTSTVKAEIVDAEFTSHGDGEVAADDELSKLLADL
ncbi:hypothetical protein UFOVP26_5 [uncultured Caudovirales phage]|uniref:Bacteriophage T4 Gp32 single-stranded DNA-binding domain-containing protein n=1 Tax=uncultured Caudovirales phage TaxID=2100421 RepID=A0A6J7WNU4_9CAUD|nr:hypothetical protein UFOVP26_5 [uncultured Caudovirales phage]CAB4123930.1 hypothetical protein UFOVP44_92 [uncultured Caudovirales phage]CAB5219447.1 hypothetical protein UFOVP220_83 [uncultured Caudovirales phage]